MTINKNYLNNELSILERVECLHSQMTMDEKLFQLACTIYVGEDHVDKKTELPLGMGEVAVYGGLPKLEDNIDFINNLQKEIVEQNRFGIPAIIHIEALSGVVMNGATSYPTAIGLGATWCEDSVKKMGETVAEQAKAVGFQQILSPVLDVTKDFRWGRTSETFGEDPTLISQIGCSYIEGMQSQNVACTGKHFLAYGAPEGGLNMARSVVSDTELEEIYAKPFEAAIRKANIKSMMNSYSEIDGEPVIASKKILRELLRAKLGFKGILISDYMSTPRLIDVFKTAENEYEAAVMCLKAGLDVECPAPISYMKLISNIQENSEIASLVNEASKRVLTLKFELGLFETYTTDKEISIKRFDREQDRELSYEIANKSIVMTKNDGTLPLNKVAKVAVIGPCANSLRSFYSCYSYGALAEVFETKKRFKDAKMAIPGVPETTMAMRGQNLEEHEIESLLKNSYKYAKTLFESLQEYSDVEFFYDVGCDVKGNLEVSTNAIDLAKDCDVVVLAVGGRNGWGIPCTTGENIDTSKVELSGNQSELFSKLYEKNQNIIVIHFDGHPMVEPNIYEKANAILECWLPGEEGGRAVADIIMGKRNVGGRMPLTVPRSTGQMPVYHYQNNGSGYIASKIFAVNPQGYVNETAEPQIPFGFGLSYTEFEYSNFEFSQEGNMLKISCVVSNVGEYDGDEVVELYGKDIVAKRIRPNQELIGFKRVFIKKSESARIEFLVNLNQLAYLNKEKWILEQGNFNFAIKKNANDIIFECEINASETQIIARHEREFFAKSFVENL